MQARSLTRLPTPHNKQSQRSADRRDEQQESRSDESSEMPMMTRVANGSSCLPKDA